MTSKSKETLFDWWNSIFQLTSLTTNAQTNLNLATASTMTIIQQWTTKNSINFAYTTRGYFQKVSLTSPNWSLMKSSSHFVVTKDTKLCNYIDACVWKLMWSWVYKLINCLSIQVVPWGTVSMKIVRWHCCW